jgi:oligopeptidase A
LVSISLLDCDYCTFVLQAEKVKFQLRLGQSKPLYNAFKAIQESPDWKTLSDARKRIVESKFQNV